MSAIYELEVCKNAEGGTLAYMSKKGSGSGYRIAGPKAWGGSRTIVKIDISQRDMLAFIRGCAPEIVEELAASATAHGEGK